MTENINEAKNDLEKEQVTEPAEDAEKTEEEIPEVVLKTEFDTLSAELNECKDRFLRTAAEYDNFRKRTAREKESLFSDATVFTVSAFLSVYDNLERALNNPTQDEAYQKGVEMTFTQFCETLKKLKVEEINPKDEKFDPQLHNAVMHVEDENAGENIIVEVFQKGFKLGDKVIRHAMVKVAN